MTTIRHRLVHTRLLGPVGAKKCTHVGARVHYLDRRQGRIIRPLRDLRTERTDLVQQIPIPTKVVNSTSVNLDFL